jgi:hypothetical protein
VGAAGQVDRLVQGRGQGAAGELAGQVEDALADLGREGGDIDQGLDVGAPSAAAEITAPPYEWPTRTIGPGMELITVRTAAASPATLRSGLAAATT